MATSTNGLPTPDLTDDNNPPADLLELANAVDLAYGAAVANPGALPASGTFTGQRKFITSTKEVATWDGTQWGGYWKTYTPSLSGTTGTFTNTEYVEIGKTVIGKFELTLTGAMSGVLLIGTPTTMSAAAGITFGIGNAVMVDTSATVTSRRTGTLTWNTGGANFGVLVDSLTTAAGVTAAVPWAWASGDVVAGTFTYKTA